MADLAGRDGGRVDTLTIDEAKVLIKKLASALRIELTNCEMKDARTVESGNHQDGWHLIAEAGRYVP